MKNIESKEIFTVPNFLTALRIVIIIPGIVLFLNHQYIMLAVLFVISALSDMFDGMIARHFNQQTKLGAILDPIADKLTLITIMFFVALNIHDIIPLVIVMIAKELLMLIGGFVLIKKKLPVISAKWFGKVATVVFYVSIITIILSYFIFGFINQILLIIATTLTFACMIGAFIGYLILFIKTLKNSK